MGNNSDKWVRCNKARKCPICGRDHYCCIAKDGSAVICTKAESDRPAGNSGGWIHRLTEPTNPHPVVEKPRQHPIPQVPQADMAKLAVEYFHRSEHPELLANALGVSVASLRRVGMGYDGANWSFPMFDARRRVCGIKLRPPAGRKFCVHGSHLGITWPKDLAGAGPLLICEGESDTAAALDLGFDVIGRPSCSGGVEIICEALNRRLRYQHVWIFEDRDEPGIKGADALAARIKPLVRGVKVLHCPWHKDLRQWLQHGGCTRPMVETLARNTMFV